MNLLNKQCIKTQPLGSDKHELPLQSFFTNELFEKYGNTTAGTLPLCLWDYENQLKKGDNLILAAFGGGFTWGSLYLKWAYDPK